MESWYKYMTLLHETERRESHRYRIQHPAKLCFQICILKDISLGGARVQSIWDYPEGKQLLLQAEPLDEKHRLSITGVIVRKRKLSDTWHEYGLKFQPISSYQKESLQQNVMAVANEPAT